MIAVVSGLPRSGTSLMMQMLEAGGMPLLTDSIRTADENNPKGYFEFDPVKRTKTDPSWLPQAEGKAVKIIYALLRDLPPTHEYRVILMQRDLDETIASQRAMLTRTNRTGAAIPDAQLQAVFAKELADTTAWLKAQPNFRTLEIDHRDCLTNPTVVAARVNAFLGGNLDEQAMSAIPDPNLYRQVFSQTRTTG
jgi:hypothetical protein